MVEGTEGGVEGTEGGVVVKIMDWSKSLCEIRWSVTIKDTTEPVSGQTSLCVSLFYPSFFQNVN